MPEKRTLEKAKQDLEHGKSPTTAAGEFVREEIEHIRRGKHGARSTKQAIAIGLSKARQAGVPLAPAPDRGRATPARKRTSRQAAPSASAGKKKRGARSSKRGAAALAALKREPRSVVSKAALSRQAKTSAARRKRSTRAQAGKPKRGAANASSRQSENAR